MKKTKICKVYGILASGALLFILLQSSCKKFIQIPPSSTLVQSNAVFNNPGTATSAMLNIYYSLLVNGNNSYFVANTTGILSDELKNYSTSTGNQEFYTNAMNSRDITISYGFWVQDYNGIYQANAVISGLKTSTALNASVKQQLTGEAYFMRAFWHFQLANCYGDIPLALTTDYTVISKLSRTPQKQVYQQVISDLKTAEGLLNANYVDATDTTVTTAKVRPNKSVAEALLAKVCLFAGDYDDAVTYSSKVIDNTSLYQLDANLNNVFLANSSEAIWQLQAITPIQNNGATNDGQNFILTSAPSHTSNSNNSSISPQLLDAFEPGDNRKTDWISSITAGAMTYNYPFKYKYNSQNAGGTAHENTMIFRLGEQYLIRAEAEANSSGGNAAAINDLNIIRNRAGLPNYSGAKDQASVLAAILHERQVELFTEWGNRWFDLRRTGNINSVMSVVTPTKGNVWNPNQALFPIPLTEIAADPNLTQNPGY